MLHRSEIEAQLDGGSELRPGLATGILHHAFDEARLIHQAGQLVGQRRVREPSAGEYAIVAGTVVVLMATRAVQVGHLDREVIHSLGILGLLSRETFQLERDPGGRLDRIETVIVAQGAHDDAILHVHGESRSGDQKALFDSALH